MYDSHVLAGKVTLIATFRTYRSCVKHFPFVGSDRSRIFHNLLWQISSILKAANITSMPHEARQDEPAKLIMPSRMSQPSAPQDGGRDSLQAGNSPMEREFDLPLSL
ncbi:hypothetical protein M404DRAFT_7016 [Pisolithus tinctorius Marx 270]|uniref:Uncharacterized protein n=1 Tax=Pisolithus tinctorius Marx 270 TaxID=870435 RepID=A0A0C3PE60_PISTI|nr:hypothetical protein M404DRAFT_7016 [Pisolithus tinctorius Marx 270]